MQAVALLYMPGNEYLLLDQSVSLNGLSSHQSLHVADPPTHLKGTLPFQEYPAMASTVCGMTLHARAGACSLHSQQVSDFSSEEVG